MNRQRLHDIAARTGSVNETEISEIKQLIGRFPFYALPHMVLAKIFYEKEHYLFENALTQAAMRVSDRATLYHYINGESEEVLEADTDATHDTVQAEAEQADSEAVSELENAAEIITEIPEPAELVESRNNLSDFLEEPVVEAESVQEEIPSEEPVIAEEEVKETGSAEPSIPQEILEEPQVLEPVAEELLSEDKTEIAEPLTETEPETGDLSEAEEETALNIALNLRKHPVYNVEEFLQNPQKENKSEEGTEEKDFFYWLRHPKKEEVKEEQVAEPEPLPDDRLSIIDQFIRSNPAISRPKKEFFNAENMAKKSEYLDLDFVSETLANIYYEQGNIDLAIKAYEKLSLQNPLKQAYFATLIEKIKKEKR